jgi:hypothetical protein
MSDGSLSSMHSPTDETVINLAERLTVRGRRAAEARFSLCLGRCSVSVRNLSDFRPKGATDEVLRSDRGAFAEAHDPSSFFAARMRSRAIHPLPKPLRGWTPGLFKGAHYRKCARLTLSATDVRMSGLKAHMRFDLVGSKIMTVYVAEIATDEVLRRDTGYHTCPLGADIAAAARIPFTAHRTSRSNSAGHAANTTFCRLWPLIW